MLCSFGFVIAAVVSVVTAQQPTWAQCGGINWSGGTTCTPGNTCVKQNDWYFQCLPAPSSTRSSSSSTRPVSSSSSSSSSSTRPVSSSSTVGDPVPTGGPNYWFSFGDSYTQTGFDPSSTLPAPGNPFGNPPYPGWTATGGANWIGFDTTTFNKSLILTYNYAYGGATIDANLVQPYTSTVLSLTDQVNQFLAGAGRRPSTSPWASSNSLFSIWIGINDIGNSYYLSGDRAAFSDTLLNAEFALVQKLYDAGARNFLFINVPCIERSPLMLAQNAQARANEKTVITGFNSKLAAKISAFKASHSGVQTWVWDSYASFSAILDSPRTYGFRDATSYGSGSDIFWGNDYHPSTTAHRIFGEQIAQILRNTIW